MHKFWEHLHVLKLPYFVGFFSLFFFLFFFFFAKRPIKYIRKCFQYYKWHPSPFYLKAMLSFFMRVKVAKIAIP